MVIFALTNKGVFMKKIILAISIAFFSVSIAFAGASYEEVEREVGCKSKYSKAKKKDIFESRYKNTWMVWSGTVVLPDSNKTSLNVDGVGTQDLVVKFKQAGAGYDLMQDQAITIKFLMDSVGGCFLPHSGKEAVIVR